MDSLSKIKSSVAASQRIREVGSHLFFAPTHRFPQKEKRWEKEDGGGGGGGEGHCFPSLNQMLLLYYCTHTEEKRENMGRRKLVGAAALFPNFFPVKRCLEKKKKVHFLSEGEKSRENDVVRKWRFFACGGKNHSPSLPLTVKLAKVKMAKSPFSHLFFAGKKGGEATAASNFDRDAAISKRRRREKRWGNVRANSTRHLKAT